MKSGETAINQQSIALGATQAVAPSMAPSGIDGFVCASLRFHRTVMVSAIVLCIADEAVPGSPTPSDQVATLKIWNATQASAMSEVWSVWDMPNSTFPTAGSVVTLTNSQRVIAQPGDEIQVLYNESGAAHNGNTGSFQIIALLTSDVPNAAV